MTNIALVLALAPVAPVTPPAAAGSLAARSAALPAHFLQVGEFSTWQRATCLVSKALQFSAIGSLTSVVAHVMGLSLSEARVRVAAVAAPCGTPYDADDSTPPTTTLLPTSAAFAVHMAVSSSTRYQLLSALEAAWLSGAPGGTAARELTSFMLRTLNIVHRRRRRCQPSVLRTAPLLTAALADERVSYWQYVGSLTWIWWSQLRVRAREEPGAWPRCERVATRKLHSTRRGPCAEPVCLHFHLRVLMLIARAGPTMTHEYTAPPNGVSNV